MYWTTLEISAPRCALMCYPSSNITYCIACLLCIGVILLNKFNSIQFNSRSKRKVENDADKAKRGRHCSGGAKCDRTHCGSNRPASFFSGARIWLRMTFNYPVLWVRVKGHATGPDRSRPGAVLPSKPSQNKINLHKIPSGTDPSHCSASRSRF